MYVTLSLLKLEKHFYFLLPIGLNYLHALDDVKLFVMEQVLAFQKSGDKLGWLKSTNESWTRVAIYISLMALYFLGGTKVKAVSYAGY